MSETAPSRRILSRVKGNESEHTQTRIKPEPIVTKPKQQQENQENMNTSLSSQQQQQHNLAISYINKEPFNEDIEIEDSNLIMDLKWRTQTIGKFKETIREIKTIVSSGKATIPMLTKSYRQGLLLCSSIKKLNRVANMRVNKARNLTHEEKNKIDEHHLELQNLLYEISHIKEEINKCLEFKSLDEDINLVDLDTFYERAPIEISQPEVTKLPENVHKLKLSRLDWELMERQNMTKRIKELESQINIREKDLKEKRDKLESLNPKLNQILDACKPTLDYFNTNYNENAVFSEQVQYLPKPLYHFYMMMTSYRETVDRDIEVEVCGDLEAAKRCDLNDTISLEEDESDSGEDENDNEYKKKKSKSKLNKKKETNREKLFKNFPLTCKLKVKVNSYGNILFELIYLNYLKIVAVKIEINLENESSSNTDSQMLNPTNMFNYLYPGDSGYESPNLANQFILNHIGIKSFESYMKPIGIPYKWCQILCGMYYGSKSESKSNQTTEIHDYITEKKLNGKGSNEKDQNSDKIEIDQSDESDVDDDEDDNDSTKNQNESKLIVQIMNRLKSRFKARVILQKTLSSTKNSTNMPNMQRLRVQSSLVGCKESSFEKFSSCSYTQHLLETKSLVNEVESSFYEIILLNSAAKLQAQVVINQDYPRVAPLFAINISWKHERNFTNDEVIRDMERELNLFRDNFNEEQQPRQKLRRSISKMSLEEKNYNLFSKQINHLLVCFDVYLESESYYLNDNEYPRNKLFTQSVRGRDRKRPFSYLANKDLFVQRMEYSDEAVKL